MLIGYRGHYYRSTICAVNNPEPLPFVKISEPTVEMTFSVNDSPFAGREGKFVTSRQIRERLYKELLKDVSLRVTDSENSDAYNVAGRGEMHLSILIETMRREGYELSVSTPRVLFKEIDGVRCEPIERLLIDVPDNCVGSVMEKMGVRKAELVHSATTYRQQNKNRVPLSPQEVIRLQKRIYDRYKGRRRTEYRIRQLPSLYGRNPHQNGRLACCV